MKKQDAAIEKYRNFMREIRYRTDVINRTLSTLKNGGALTGFRESDIELVFLQFRHCLELMMFASLSAHYHTGHELSRKILNKEYNASKLLRFLRTKNPKFYPKPVEIGDKKNEDGMYLVEDILDGYLTENEFCTLYDKTCGKLLHAQRTSKFDDNHDELVSEALAYRDKMMNLLNCHWVHLNDAISFRVVMRDAQTGDVGINVMRYIGQADEL